MTDKDQAPAAGGVLSAEALLHAGKCRTMAAKPAPATTEEAPMTITSYKGFEQDWTCRGFQYAIGETAVHTGEVSACNGGLHACEYPLHVLRYYKPATSRYAVVEQSGELSRHGKDSKVASSRLTVKAEVSLPGLIKAAVEYTLSRCKPAEGGVSGEPNTVVKAEGKNQSATASGNSGAATASGDSGAATASGNYGAAMASGRHGRAKGADGCALFLVERDSNWQIVSAWAGIVGRDGIKADTFYKLVGGIPVEV